MKKKVVILYNQLFHYRIPIFNLLSEQYDLTVVYSYPAKDEVINQCSFKTYYLPIKRIGKLYYHPHHRKMISMLCNGADAVIAYGQITYLDYTALAFKKRPFKLLFWSIGAPASYKRRFGEASSFNYLLNDVVSKRADALILYSEKAKELHVSRGFDEKCLFVANNTVKVEKIDFNPSIKQNLLFIGTLYLEKGLQLLLDSYKAVNEINVAIPKLVIVGGGEQYIKVKEWVCSNNLENKIELLGPIYNPIEKAEIFKRSLVCISPDQAGLSVLESMGYGVPFVTGQNAITGGESFNIQDGINGILIKDVSDMKDVIIDITKDKEKYIRMGENAFLYYWEKRTPEIMAQGIMDAIEYTIKNV